ncbi:MAG: endonuclease MutS2 [Oscillospiraceae bacterium]
MNFIDRSIKKLEFDKILKKLSKKLIFNENIDNVFEIKPFKNYDDVTKNLDNTDFMFKLLLKYGNFNIEKIENIKETLNKCSKDAVLEIEEIFKISKLLCGVTIFKDWCQCDNFNDDTELKYTIKMMVELKTLQDIIKKTFVDENTIADNATSKLYDIRESIRFNTNRVRQIVDEIAKNKNTQKYLMDNVVTVRENRFVVPVKAEYKNNIKGLIHHTSSSGSTFFIEPLEAVETNNYIKELLGEEKKEIYNILKGISKIISENYKEIIYTYNSFLDIDIILAKAKMAIEENSNRPKINKNKKINIVNGKHPLIDKAKVVPINIYVGHEFDALIITGPNTGGKTVALKIVGLFTLMGLSGFFVNADESTELSFFDNIYSDIGDEQSIEQNLSTFSSHMTNIISITKDIDENENNLVLLDELGSGTDPVEGASLAIGIIDYIKNKKAVIIASTHYSEVKTYATNTDNVENASCHFDVETLMPTYRFFIGVPGSSNAFSISKKLGLKNEILEYSKSILDKEKGKLEITIKNLEKSKLEIENQKLEISKMQEDLQKENIRQEEIRMSLESDFNNQRQINRDKASYLLDNLIIETNKIFEEIENNKKQFNKNKNYENLNKLKQETYKQIDDLSGKIKKPNKVQKNDKSDSIIKVGDTVYLLDIEKNATVTKCLDKNNMIEVSLGIFKTKTHIDNISKVNQKNITIKSGSVTKQLVKKDMAKKMSIDVRGLTVEEALMDIDLFIDNNVLSNIEFITIVHGKGTGALRKGIHNHLKKHKSIDSFRVGVFGEGEDGVTIINLK